MKPKVIALNAVERRYMGIDRLDFTAIYSKLGFRVAANHIYQLAPGALGGNHRHDKLEAFVGLGEGLVLYWLDEKGRLKSEAMFRADQLKLCIVPNNLAHAVRNEGSYPAFLLEYADKFDVTPVKTKVIEY